MSESRRFRYIIFAAIDSHEPGIHSPAGLSWTVDEVLKAISHPENRDAIRELWNNHDQAITS